MYGCFYELQVFLVGVLVMRAVLLGFFIGAPDFWKLAYMQYRVVGFSRWL